MGEPFSWRWFVPLPLRADSASYYEWRPADDPDSYDPRDPLIRRHFKKLEVRVVASRLWAEDARGCGCARLLGRAVVPLERRNLVFGLSPPTQEAMANGWRPPPPQADSAPAVEDVRAAAGSSAASTPQPGGGVAPAPRNAAAAAAAASATAAAECQYEPRPATDGVRKTAQGRKQAAAAGK